MDKQALHIAGPSVLLSRENRSCCDSTVSTSPPEGQKCDPHKVPCLDCCWLLSSTSSPAWAGSGSAGLAQLSTHVQVLFRHGKNNSADVQCFHIVCWRHMQCLFSLHSSESGARQAKLHEIQCLGCLSIQCEGQGQKNSYNEEDE